MRSGNNLRRAALTLVALAGMVVAAQAPALAGPPAPDSPSDRRPASTAPRAGALADIGPVLIRTFSSKCLDQSGQGTTSGVPIVQFACQGQQSQKWLLVDRGGGFYWIQSVRTPQLCMAVQGDSQAQNAAIIQFRCNDGRNQLWGFFPRDNNGVSPYRIRKLFPTDKCMTISNVSTDNNAPLVQFTCGSPGGNDIFSLQTA